MILITGALGYIGSHTTLSVLEKGFTPILLDNLSNSDPVIHSQLEKISGSALPFFELDACATKLLETDIFSKYKISAIIHFAAFKSVSESVRQPVKYYHNNLNSLLSVLYLAEKFQIPHFIFSSSCTVYGENTALPVTEDTPQQPATNPYGAGKQMCERILFDFYKKNPALQCVILRYFNPAGAHHSGLLGELPLGDPQNLIPALTQSAIGKAPPFCIFGADYPTRDGSCIRDFIHIEDLAEAHTQALQYLIHSAHKTENVSVFNLGTGEGISVLEAIQAFTAHCAPLPYELRPRRAGDVGAIYSDNQKARKILRWSPKKNIRDIVQSAWKWEQYVQKNIKK